MKKNWIKGLDRIAILLAIPMAIFGASYSSKRFSEKCGVVVYACENDWNKAKVIYEGLSEEKRDVSMMFMITDDPKRGGLIASGGKELAERKAESLPMNIALERAIKNGGDQYGTLVNQKTFGVHVGAEHVDLCLIPSQWKRWSVGIMGAIGFAITTVLSVALSTRGIPQLVKWIRRGFLSE